MPWNMNDWIHFHVWVLLLLRYPHCWYDRLARKKTSARDQVFECNPNTWWFYTTVSYTMAWLGDWLIEYIILWHEHQTRWVRLLNLYPHGTTTWPNGSKTVRLSSNGTRQFAHGLLIMAGPHYTRTSFQLYCCVCSPRSTLTPSCENRHQIPSTPVGK